MRTGGAYFLDDRFSFATGYAHLWLARSSSSDTDYQNDNRLFQHALWRVQIEHGTLFQRVRIEQCWQGVLDENVSVDRTRYTTRHRFLLSGTIRIFDNPYLPKLVLSDEVHIQFCEEVVYNIFDQNRIFLGISQRFSPVLSLDLGYMNVYQQAYTGHQYDMNNTIRLFFQYIPDFRKKVEAGFPHYPALGEE